MDSKQLTFLIWIIFLLNAIVTLSIIKTAKKNNNILSQKENFIKQNRLPKTSFQIKSMQNELQSIDNIQSDLRESIYYVSKFKLNSNEFFKRVYYVKNKLNYTTKIVLKKRKKEFKKYLKNRPKSDIAMRIN
jgi:hypothetical protein